MKHLFKIACLVLQLVATSVSANTLRTAAQESPPKFFKHSDGGMTGIGYDVMRAIERLDPSIRFSGDQSFVPIKRIEIMLEHGDLDVFFGFIKSEERAAKFVFIEPPLYRVSDVLLAREDDPIDVQRLEDIALLAPDGIVLVASGTAQAAQLKKMNIVVDDGGKSVAINLYKLLRQRGRLVFQSEVEIVSALKEYKMENSFRILPTRFNESGRYVAFSNSVPAQTIAKVQVALDRLNKSGELAQILSKYR
ncbi:MAG: transporter substrate-binding domain-containing protein [Rhodoferax sp.]|nr:transporter substrate-binding domain-containing protein [Rhodoferax sp.]MDP3650802.1 transporter substrate-binding domain-containing protein [Rhodoferax sp.]